MEPPDIRRDEQLAWLQVKRRTTELLVLLAWSRGRLRIQDSVGVAFGAPARRIPEAFRARAGTEDVAVWHARLAERVAKDYAPPPATLEGAASELV